MQDQIIQHLKQRKMSMDALYQALLLVNADDYKALAKTLNQMEEDYLIALGPDFKYRYLTPSKVFKGTLDLKAKGYGFLLPEAEGYDDIYIPPGQTEGAMDKDTVLVEISGNFQRRVEGRVIKIIQRHYQNMIGTLIIKPKAAYVEPLDKSTPLPVKIKLKHTEGYHHLDRVEVKIYSYQKDHLKGQITRKLGSFKDADLDIQTKIFTFGFDPLFPSYVLEDAEKLSMKNDERKDLRDLLTYTIDGDDAKDFDDAISFITTPQDTTLYVHIADVAYFVTPGSSLDNEALKRGTSVYLPTRVLPMLPERLSNDLCSLKEGVDRYTLTCEMHFNQNADLTGYDIYPSLIHSDARLTYTGVNALLESKKTPIQNKAIIHQLKAFHFFAMKLRQKRFEKGSMNFETDEVGFEIKNHQAVGIYIKDRGDAEKMIEDAMLMANQVVAMHLSKHKIPALYRVHDAPEATALDRLEMISSHYGFKVKGHLKSQEHLKALTDAIVGSPFEKGLTMMMLRSMQKAVYQDIKSPHFGLGFDDYAHFTSPIRRYPDLIVHRMLRMFAFEKGSEQEKKLYASLMPSFGEKTSAQERKALDLERDVISMHKAQLMASKVGETFKGIITSVVPFGLYITLDNAIEGLLHISSLNHYYHYDEKTLTLKSLETDLAFQLGDEIVVQCKKVNVFEGEIDFVLGAAS